MPKKFIRLEGYDRAWRRAEMVEKLLPSIIASALYAEAKHIMNKSKAEFVPIRQDYGALLASSYVNPPEFHGTVVEVELGYGGTERVQYASWIHEHQRSGRTQGIDPQGRPYPPRSWATTGQPKYLEKPAQALKPTSGERISLFVQNKLHAALGVG